MASKFKKFLERRKARKNELADRENMQENNQEENERQREIGYLRKQVEKGGKLDLSGADGLVMSSILDELESNNIEKRETKVETFENDITDMEKDPNWDAQAKELQIEESKMNKAEAIEARTEAMDKYYKKILNLKIGYLGKIVETPASVYFGEVETMEDLLRQKSLRKEIGKIDSPIAGESTEDYLTRLLRESQITPDDVDILVKNVFNQR